MKTQKITPRRKQKERSTESAKRLLGAMLALIAEKGFDKTTVAEIGERAGYSRTMVRHRYGSKEQLIETLLETEYKAKMLPPINETQPGIEQVLIQIDRIRELAKQNPELLRAFFILAFEATGSIPVLTQWMLKWRETYLLQTAATLRKGQIDGSVRRDIDPDDEAKSFNFYGTGLGYFWTLDPSCMDFDKELEKWSAKLNESWVP